MMTICQEQTKKRKKVETEQRKRVAERKEKGEEHTAKYFQESEFGWALKENVSAIQIGKVKTLKKKEKDGNGIF